MIARHLKAEPIPPSIRSGRAVPPQLENLILACLAKDPGGRPADAEELSRRLAEADVEPWTLADARAWWEANLGTARPEPSTDFPTSWPTRVDVAVGHLEPR